MPAKLVIILFIISAVLIGLLTALIIWAGICICREVDRFHRTTRDAMAQIETLTERVDELNSNS